MEQYKSPLNVNHDLVKVLQTQKQSMEGTWKLDGNMSGKLAFKFAVAYTKRPLLHVVVSVDQGNVLDCHHCISNFTEKGFELHIANNDVTNQIAGSFLWHAQPINISA